MGDLYSLCEPQNSGTGANMQFSSYLSPCYYIPSAGNTLPRWDGDVTWMSRNGYNDLVQPSCFSHYKVYEKEMIRQAMLKHEATFRYQVHELHRMFKRQNELMAEHRMREHAAHQVQIQRSQRDWLVNSVIPDISQKAAPPWSFVNAEGCVPSLSSQRYLQSPIFPGYGLQSDNNSVLTERSPADNEGLPPQKNKHGKRMIDLELPAVLYIDSDEEDTSICSKSVADVPPAFCSLAKETPEFHLEGDQRITFETTGSVNINFSCEGTKLCIDLNEPFQLEDDESYSSSHLKSVTCSTQTVQLSPVSSRKLVKESKASNCDSVMPLEEKQVEHQPLNSEPVADEIVLVQHSSAEGTSLASNISSESHDSPKTIGSCMSCSPQLVPHSADSDIKALSSVTSQRRPPSDLREVPLAVQALPCFNTTKVNKGTKSAYSSSRNHTSKLMVKKNSANVADIGKEPFQVHKRLAKRMKNLRDHKLPEYVDLNCMPPDLESYQQTEDLNVGAPVSLKNSECHLPRRENGTFEVPLYLRKEDVLNVGELDKIAAEAIILMSSSRGAMTPEPSGPLVNCLNWFAGITSSVSEDLCDEIKEICNKAADCDDLLGSFRATNLETRKVRVKRINDASCRGKKQNEKDAREECLPRMQGHGRRPKKPRILKEKSLHANGMERRTDTAFDNIKRRKRNTCNSSPKRRTHIAITHCDDLERSMCSSPISNTKGKTEGKCLPRWGSGAGRRKARKARRVLDVFSLDLSDN